MLKGMKRIFISLLAATMFVACVTDGTDQLWLEKVPIKISVDKPTTKSRANDSSFEVGDEIGLYVVNYENSAPGELLNSGNHADNVRFTLSDSWTSYEEIYWKNQSTKTDFYVYYPYFANGIADVTAYAHAVSIDQSTEENYFASDFLWGKKEGVSPTKEAVAISTKHLYSNALIYIIPGEGFTAEELATADINVLINNVRVGSEINLQTGEVTAVGDISYITPWNTGSYYRAMIVPQTVTSDNKLLTIRINNLIFEYADNITFQSGSRHKIEVTVSRQPSNELSVNFSIEKWVDDETIYGGEASLTSHSAQDLINALISTHMGYGQMDWGYPSLMMYRDFMTGDFIPCNPTNWIYIQFYWVLLHGAGSPTSTYTYLYWDHYYYYLQICNNIIETHKQDASKKELVAIARTFRALFHLDMARMYDALPAESQLGEYNVEEVKGLTSPIINEKANQSYNPRATRDEMFKFIFNDLDTAGSAFSNGYVPENKTFPSLAVVYGLKARAYLWLGGFEDGLYAEIPTGIAAYREAAKYARMAISTSGATPVTKEQYQDKVSGFNTVNQAWMWAMVQSVDTVLGNLHSFTAQISPEALWGYGGIVNPGVSKMHYDRMGDADIRKQIIVGPETTYEDFAQYTSIPGEVYWNSWGAFETGVGPYSNFKFRPGSGNVSDYRQGNATSIPLMRVEEMMLIEAEATAHYDESTAVELLMAFMTYRDENYVLAGYDLIEEIIFQKRMELWGEGQIVFDLKRLDYGINLAYEGSNAQNGFRFKTDHRVPCWNFCFPLKEIQQNAGVVNNPNPIDLLRSNDVVIAE